MRWIIIPAAFAAASTAAFAQQAPSPTPIQAPAPQPSADAATSVEAAPQAASAPPAIPHVSLPANSEIKVGLMDALNSKKARLGDKFKIVTLVDVMQDGVVVIPAGTQGEGNVSFRGGSGSFGKSGKLEISFTSLDLGGKPFAIAGKFRDEGKGNGGAATGAVLAAGLVGGLFVHGHSAKIDKDQVMIAHSVDVLTVDAPASAGVAQ